MEETLQMMRVAQEAVAAAAAEVGPYTRASLSQLNS
jgi:hypothetical protein